MSTTSSNWKKNFPSPSPRRKPISLNFRCLAILFPFLPRPPLCRLPPCLLRPLPIPPLSLSVPNTAPSLLPNLATDKNPATRILILANPVETSFGDFWSTKFSPKTNPVLSNLSNLWFLLLLLLLPFLILLLQLLLRCFPLVILIYFYLLLLLPRPRLLRLLFFLQLFFPL